MNNNSENNLVLSEHICILFRVSMVREAHCVCWAAQLLPNIVVIDLISHHLGGEDCNTVWPAWDWMSERSGLYLVIELTLFSLKHIV